MYLTSKNAGLCVVFTKLEESKWRLVTHQAFASPRLEFDRYELQIYEEVAKMPPFQRKTLVLIGAQGVGRRSLKNRLIFMNPLRYGTTVPCEYTTQRAANIAPLTNWRIFSHFLASHVSPAEGRGAGRSELLLCYAGRDGKGYQGGPVLGARRVWRQPLRHKNGLYPRGGGCWPHLHPGRQPSGLLEMLTLLFPFYFLVFTVCFLLRLWRCWRLLSLCHLWCLSLLLS